MNGSFNIGITGEWGTGKSTFLNMIKKNISKFKGTKDIYILQYDAVNVFGTKSNMGKFCKNII